MRSCSKVVPAVLVFSFLLLSASHLHAADGLMQGHVSASVLPSYKIEGATVTVFAPDGEIHSTQTDTEGFYSVDVTGGKSYTLTVSKSGWTSPEPVSPVQVDHSATVTRDLTLDTAPVMNDTPVGSPVAVCAVVFRQSAVYDTAGACTRNGFRYCYYVYQPESAAGAQVRQLCRVSQRTSDPYFTLDDRVIVEGIWQTENAYFEPYVSPIKSPVFVSSGGYYPAHRRLANPPQYGQGGFYAEVVGKVTAIADPLGTSRISTITVDIDWNSQTPVPVIVELDTKGSIGVDPAKPLPFKVGDMIGVRGVIGKLDIPWQNEWVLKPGMTGDFRMSFLPMPDLCGSKKEGDGSIFNHCNQERQLYITYANPSGLGNFFYLEDPKGRCGIRVLPGSTGYYPLLGVGEALASVTGFLGRSILTGERTLTLIEPPTSAGVADPVEPYMMTTRDIGGASVWNAAGIPGGVGPSNVGSLVRVAGTVSYTNGVDAFYIYDGVDCANDTSGLYQGLKVKCPYVGPGVGDLVKGSRVAVTGVVSLEKTTDGRIAPVLLMRDCSTDITYF